MFVRSLLSFSLLALSSCSLFFGVSTRDECTPQSHPSSCEGAILETCVQGDLFRIECESAELCDAQNNTCALCGDTFIQSANNEACDDGNTIDGDGCDAECKIESCGDGITNDVNEQCDDGDLTNEDSCTNLCQNARCGDGFRRQDLIAGEVGVEECDDNDNNAGDGCDANCVVEFCGDGIANNGDSFGNNQEGCDDANNDDTDACTNLCETARCGDNIVRTDLIFGEPGFEGCDDGNNIAGDGCSDLCVVEFCGDNLIQPGLGEQCDEPDLSVCRPDCVLRCGDGIIDAVSETCDDANFIDEDGCTGCLREENFSCVGAPSSCVFLCGNGVVDLLPDEQCDDRNLTPGDGCDSSCKIEGLLFEREPNEDGSISTSSSELGNDFSTVNAEGPFTQATIISGLINPAGDEDVYAVQNTSNTIIQARATAFDHSEGANATVCGFRPNLALRDAAGSQIASFVSILQPAGVCTTLDFSLAPGQTRFLHLVEGNDSFQSGYYLQIRINPRCGDGFRDPNEQCDDENNISGDGCSNACQVEPGFACTGALSNCYPIVCGDGFVDGSEECDDGNTTNGDGCSSFCGLVVLACPAGQTLLQLASTDVPKAILDATPAGITSFINVNDNRLIKQVIVRVDNLTHSFTGDLSISLLSPLNTAVLLFAQRGDAGDDLLNTSFRDECLVLGEPIADGTAPFTGCFAPESPLSAFINQSANGQWRLKIVDSLSNDIGTLNAWTLGLCVQ